MISLDQLYSHLHHRFPTAFWNGNPARPEIALTFDDGPDAQSTPALLALLDELEIKATFFHIGQKAQHAPDLVRQVAAAGHQIGLHGYQHNSFLLQSRRALLTQLATALQVVADATGDDPAHFNAVRPPFGHFTKKTLDMLNGAGYLPTMWSVVPFHWLQSAAMTHRQIINDVQNGTILVLHEAMPGPAVVDLARVALPKLLAAEFRFVTIHELWANLQQDTQ